MIREKLQYSAVPVLVKFKLFPDQKMVSLTFWICEILSTLYVIVNSVRIL